jgi:hypothetical protein
MDTSPDASRREGSGGGSTLFWQSVKNRLWVRVGDARTEEEFLFDVAPADALDAFHRPFAVAGRPAFA